MKVQVTQTGKVRISGERQVGEKESVRFRQEFPVPENCDADKASASFRGGQLYVKIPKFVVPAAEIQPEKKEPKPTPLTEPPKPDQKTEKKENQVAQATPPASQEGVPAALLPQKKHQDLQQNDQTKVEGHCSKPRVLGGNLVRKIRNPGSVLKLGIAVVAAVVIFLYAKNSFKFLLGGPGSSEEL